MFTSPALQSYGSAVQIYTYSALHPYGNAIMPLKGYLEVLLTTTCIRLLAAHLFTQMENMSAAKQLDEGRSDCLGVVFTPARPRSCSILQL